MDKLKLIKIKQAKLEFALKLIRTRAAAECRTLFTKQEESEVSTILSEYVKTLEKEKAFWEGD